MSTAVAVNDNTSGKTPLNKIIGLGITVYAVIEAIAAYFLVLGPLFVSPVFRQCREYNESGVTCIIRLFGKTFASQKEIADNQIILSLWDTIFNIALIYLIVTGITILLAVCLFKGFAFAKSYLTAVFGAKAMIGFAALLIPFGLLRNSMKIFGAVDAVLCIAACAYFVYINSIEYADDMLYTDEQRADMKKRGIRGAVMFGMLAAAMIFLSFGMGAMGGTWSIYLGWLSDTAIGQGCVLAILLAIGAIGSIVYVREGDWAEFFYGSFGAAGAISIAIAIFNRIMWIFQQYNPMKALAKQGDEDAIAWIGSNGMTASWWRNTIFLILGFVALTALAVYTLLHLRKKIDINVSSEQKLPSIAVLISAGTIVLSFILTVAAITMWHKVLYQGAALGAMDYMYFIVYGGVTLFLALAMLGGYSFTKFGTLALYLIVASSNFQTIFTVFSQRSTAVASYAEQGIKYMGTNYIISGILYILATLSCFAIIVAFVIKGVDDYMYQKRFS